MSNDVAFSLDLWYILIMAELYHLPYAPILLGEHQSPLNSRLQSPLGWLLCQGDVVVSSLTADVTLPDLEGVRHRHISNPLEGGIVQPTDSGARYIGQDGETITIGPFEQYGALMILFAGIGRSGPQLRCPVALTATNKTSLNEEVPTKLLILGELTPEQRKAAEVTGFDSSLRRPCTTGTTKTNA